MSRLSIPVDEMLQAAPFQSLLIYLHRYLCSIMAGRQRVGSRGTSVLFHWPGPALDSSSAQGAQSDAQVDGSTRGICHFSYLGCFKLDPISYTM